MRTASTAKSGPLHRWVHIVRTCGPPAGAAIDPVAKALIVSRACVQPMTLTAIAVAGGISWNAPAFDPLWFGLAALGVIVAHAANNMINDLFDLDSGLDTTGYPRALYAPHPVLEGLVSRRGLVLATLGLNVVDAAVMITLLVVRGWPVVAFAGAGLFISVFYVAPPLRLKSRGLGEPGVFLVWGPLMIGGLYYAAVGRFDAVALWASIPYGLLVTSVLMAKHMDKRPWDAEAGVRTLPVILGETWARRTTAALMIGSYAAVGILVVTGVVTPWALAAVVGLPRLVKALRVMSRPRPDRPPPDYPLWPLWYVAWAFVHSRRAGALYVLGLLVGAAVR